MTTTNTHSLPGEEIKFCSPYAGEKKLAYYVDIFSNSIFELGTLEHPFKTMEAPHKELLNFVYDPEFEIDVLYKRRMQYKHYYGIMPVNILGLKMVTMKPYGDEEAANPHFIIVDHEYQWPQSTIFSLDEVYYDF